VVPEVNGRRQVVITTIQDKKMLFYMEEEQLYDVLLEPKQDASLAVGNIYVGKVKNIVKNISAAFVEVQKDVLCYLPLTGGKNQAVKCGDELIVQVKKPAVKTKQAVITASPEITGRYCVVTTANDRRGISKKISNDERRRDLQQILDSIEPSGIGVVLRTAAQHVPADMVLAECRRLMAELQQIMEYGRYQTCFSVLRSEAPFYLRYLYGCQPEQLERIITDDSLIYEKIKEECERKHPDFMPLLTFYEDTTYSLDKLLGISQKLERALKKRVWLNSGGNLVIEPTEALTVIDVNTGKATDGRREKETTFFKINCEAAQEAARQIRLRNLSGIILIDFIDMKKPENRTELMNQLRRYLQQDKTRTVLVDITKLGLVEITRMKQNPPLHEFFSQKP
jgi:ribonuclease G